jgi:ABC-type dipeptide/oligopeptide/nickel transport system ATPase component
LPVIAGGVPDPRRRPPGCAYAPPCDIAIADCTAATPQPREVAPARHAACIRA